MRVRDAPDADVLQRCAHPFVMSLAIIQLMKWKSLQFEEILYPRLQHANIGAKIQHDQISANLHQGVEITNRRLQQILYVLCLHVPLSVPSTTHHLSLALLSDLPSSSRVPPPRPHTSRLDLLGRHSSMSAYAPPPRRHQPAPPNPVQSKSRRCGISTADRAVILKDPKVRVIFGVGDYTAMETRRSRFPLQSKN